MYVSNSGKSIIKNCTFIANCNRIRYGILRFRVVRYSLVQNCSFIKNTVNAGGVVELIMMNDSAIKDCLVAGNSNLYGGTVLLIKVNNSIIYSSIFVRNDGFRGGAIVFFNNVKHSSIGYCNLINNFAKVGGAISINSNGNFTISNCNLENNTASTLGSSIYNLAKLPLVNTTLDTVPSSSIYALHSQIGELNLENVVLKVADREGASEAMCLIFVTSNAHITVSDGLNISCPINYNIHVQNNSYNEYKFGNAILFVVQCRSCPRGRYSNDKGKLYTTSSTERPSIDMITCFKCPNGGTCHIGIKAMGNFWGYENTTSQKINFLPCPSGYCCSDKTSACSSYNTSNHGRKGILCGSCIDNYTLGFHRNKCIPKNSVCNVRLFCVYFICYSLLYTLFWIYITDIGKSINKLIVAMKVKCTHRKQNNNGDDCCDTDKNKHMPVNFNSPSNQCSCVLLGRENAETADDFWFSGLLKLIFYFYQIAFLINVDLPSNMFHTSGYMNNCKKAIANLFNFRFIIYQNICPTSNLDKITREFINFLLKLSFFFNLFIYYLLSRFIHIMKSKIQNIGSNQIDRTQEKFKPLLDNNTTGINSNRENLTDKLKRCFFRLLSLVYIPFAIFAFNMVNCVDILGKSHLYIYGDLQCYVWWQKLIFSVLIPWILMFPLSTQISKHMMKKRQVSLNHYLCMNLFPPYTICLYAKKCLYGYVQTCPSKDEAASINAFMKEADDMFRSNDTLICWKVVLLIRSLTISGIRTFFINPMFRLAVICPIFCVCLIHDMKAMPFKHRALNGLQIYFSFCLLVLTMCNEMFAVSYMNDITGIPGIEEFIIILDVLHYMLLLFPLPLWVVGWRIWTIWTFNVGRKGKKID